METDDHLHSDSHLQPIESCQLIQPVCHGLREETGTAEPYCCHFNWEQSESEISMQALHYTFSMCAGHHQIYWSIQD